MKIIIAHAAWAPERAAHVATMEQAIGTAEVVASYAREHASVWFRRVLMRAVETAGPACILNDDVIVCDNFARVVDQLAASAPGRDIAFHVTAPVAPSLVMCGERWLESYWCTGPGFIIADPEAMLAWLDAQPKWLATGCNEDVIMMHWAWSRRSPILHALPAIVQHRVDIKSTLGYDHHPLRQTETFGAQTEPWPAPEPFVVRVACPWYSERMLARTEGALKAHVEPGPEPRVAFASPSKGGAFTEEYVASLWQTALRIRNGEMTWLRMRYADDSVDIIRGRARFQRIFLEETNCTELLWVDDDMQWAPEAFLGVVMACHAGKDVIGIPYPMKKTHWERLEAGGRDALYNYPIHASAAPELDGQCVTVASMGMGLMCVSRRAVALMHDEALSRPVHEGEWFVDADETGTGPRTANTFGFIVTPGGALLSDSHTLCYRWRHLAGTTSWADGRVWMYCGQGSPAGHVGKHLYQGSPKGVAAFLERAQLPPTR